MQKNLKIFKGYGMKLVEGHDFADLVMYMCIYKLSCVLIFSSLASVLEQCSLCKLLHIAMNACINA